MQSHESSDIKRPRRRPEPYVTRLLQRPRTAPCRRGRIGLCWWRAPQGRTSQGGPWSLPGPRRHVHRFFEYLAKQILLDLQNGRQAGHRTPHLSRTRPVHRHVRTPQESLGYTGRSQPILARALRSVQFPLHPRPSGTGNCDRPQPRL
eukprot:scaffold23292_cov72-Phaeocystis_antarctica.AAC.2